MARHHLPRINHPATHPRRRRRRLGPHTSPRSSISNSRATNLSHHLPVSLARRHLTTQRPEIRHTPPIIAKCHHHPLADHRRHRMGSRTIMGVHHSMASHPTGATTIPRLTVADHPEVTLVPSPHIRTNRHSIIRAVMVPVTDGPRVVMGIVSPTSERVAQPCVQDPLLICFIASRKARFCCIRAVRGL